MGKMMMCMHKDGNLENLESGMSARSVEMHQSIEWTPHVSNFDGLASIYDKK